MARNRKTISFKENVFKYLEEARGKLSLSTYVNEVFEKIINKKKSN